MVWIETSKQAFYAYFGEKNAKYESLSDTFTCYPEGVIAKIIDDKYYLRETSFPLTVFSNCSFNNYCSFDRATDHIDHMISIWRESQLFIDDDGIFVNKIEINGLTETLIEKIYYKPYTMKRAELISKIDTYIEVFVSNFNKSPLVKYEMFTDDINIQLSKGFTVLSYNSGCFRCSQKFEAHFTPSEFIYEDYCPDGDDD